MKGKPKASATKTIEAKRVYRNEQWTVHYGTLKPGRGRPELTARLFSVLGEKLPYECLNAVRNYLRKSGLTRQGVYVAHDSMGCARYIGRGNIFSRLETRRKAQVLELKYFSFYVVKDKKHEREIETLLIRAAGPLLEFNTKKKTVTISTGNIRDYATTKPGRISLSVNTRKAVPLARSSNARHYASQPFVELPDGGFELRVDPRAASGDELGQVFSNRGVSNHQELSQISERVSIRFR